MTIERARTTALAALLALAGALTFLPTWTAPFAEDDYLYLDAVARSGGGDVLRYFLGEGVLDHHYRPLSDPLFFCVARNPTAYHLLLLALHAGSACLIFALGLRLGLDRAGSWLGALLYVTRDFTFPSMLWASGVSDIGAACLGLLSAYAYVAWLGSRRLAPRLVSVAALLAAMLTKETAVVMLGLYPVLALLSRRANAFPETARARGSSLLHGQWVYWVTAMPLAVVQLSLARFDDVYGRAIYSTSLGWHTLGLWPFYGFFSFAGIRELLPSSAARAALYAVCGLAALFFARRIAGRGRRQSIAALAAVAWFTIAIFPALVTPNRILTNYVALAAAGACLAAGLALASWIARARAFHRALALGTTVVLVACGPVVVSAKHRGRIDPGGWVDPANARRMAEVAERIATAVPEPPPGAVIVVFGDPGLGLTVLSDLEGRGFGPLAVFPYALRWRYGRTDLTARLLPPLEHTPDEAWASLRRILDDRAGALVRVVDATGAVTDITKETRAAARQSRTPAQFREALSISRRPRVS